MSKQTFKVLVLGPPNVGKTSLVQRYTQGVFEENYNPTIGFDVSTEELVFHEDESKLAIMD
jgi:Ras-related protein Rab-32/Rab family protein